jgi:hypothetical protein
MADQLIKVDVRQWRTVSKLLRAMPNHKDIRKQLLLELRKVAEPAADKARQNILGMSSKGARHKGGSLRAKVAKRVQTKATLGGRKAGVRVLVAQRIGLPRGFFNAPAQLNRKSFRHPVYGRPDSWTVQVGEPGWFDLPLIASRRAASQAAVKVLQQFSEDMVREIER